MNSFFWQSKPWQAFINFAIIFSFIMNFILLVVVLLAAPLILPIISEIATPIVGGLSSSFEEMNEAEIVRTIPVNDQLDIKFDLPLNQQTNVVLADSVPLNVQATFLLPGGGGNINGTVSIELPEGTILPVVLNLNVPVEETIDVKLDVLAEIPLAETDLGVPFSNLQNIFTPLDEFLQGLPQDNRDLQTRLNASLQNDDSQETSVADSNESE